MFNNYICNHNYNTYFQIKIIIKFILHCHNYMYTNAYNNNYNYYMYNNYVLNHNYNNYMYNNTYNNNIKFK